MITLRAAAGQVVLQVEVGGDVATSDLTPEQADALAGSLRRMAYEARTGAGMAASLTGLIRMIGCASA